MKKLVLLVAGFFGISGPAFAVCPSTFAVMHDFPGTSFNMSLANNAGDGNCASNVGIIGTLPPFAAIPAFKIDQTTPGTTNLVAASQSGAWTVAATQSGAWTAAATQSGTWNITNVSGTVSLPTGASTAAKQPALGTAGTPSTDVLTVQGAASMIPFLTNPATASNWGINALGSATSGQSGELVLGAVTTAAPTYTTGQSNALSLDTAGNLRVNVVVGGGGGGGGAVTVANGADTAQGSTTDAPTVGPTTTAAATEISLLKGILNVTGTGGGGGVVSNAGTFPVQLTGATNNINNISGTISLPTGAATSALQPTNAPLGSTTSGQTGNIAMGAVTTAVPSYTTGQTNAFSMTTAGALRVDGSGVTQPVSLTSTTITGTVAATQSGTWNIGAITTLPSIPAGSAVIGKVSVDQTTPGTTNLVSIGTNGTVNPTTAASWGIGTSTQNSASVANGHLMLGQFNTSPTTITTGNMSPLQLDASGNILVNVKAGGVGGGAVFGPTAVGSANANPPIVIGGTVTGAAGQNVVGVAAKAASTAAAATDASLVTNESPNSQLSVVNGTTTDAPCTLPASATACTESAVLKAIANAANAPAVFAGQYPSGAVAITASATGTTAATTATLAGTAGKTTYICGYSIRANATANTNVTNTITGVVTATMSSIMWIPANTAGLGVDEQIFNPCIPASATNTAIAVVSGAPGTGGLVSSRGWGYQL